MDEHTGLRSVLEEAWANDVSEVYSLPRTSRRAVPWGMRSGWSLDHLCT